MASKDVFPANLLLISCAAAVEVNNVNQLEALKNYQSITIKDLRVPAGQTLDLTNFKPGTVLESAGKTTSEYAEWAGEVGGKDLDIWGRPVHLFDLRGCSLVGWQGPGGKKKPRFMEIIVDDSAVTGLNIDTED